MNKDILKDIMPTEENENQGKEHTLKAQIPVRIFELTERKSAVMYALKTHGQLFVWATDGNSDWLRRGDQSECPYTFVVIDPNYILPDFVQLVPVDPDYSMHDPNEPLGEEGEAMVLEALEQQLYAQEEAFKPEESF